MGAMPPKWMERGTSQSAMRRQLWRVEEDTVKVDMELCRVWDTATQRTRLARVQDGGVWPVEASCVVAMVREGKGTGGCWMHCLQS